MVGGQGKVPRIGVKPSDAMVFRFADAALLQCEHAPAVVEADELGSSVAVDQFGQDATISIAQHKGTLEAR